MASEAFETWWKSFRVSGDICPLRLGQTRDEVRALFGEPDDVGVVSRHRARPGIWKYGDVELHFDATAGDRLFLIYMDDASGVLLCIRATPEDR